MYACKKCEKCEKCVKGILIMFEKIFSKNMVTVQIASFYDVLRIFIFRGQFCGKIADNIAFYANVCAFSRLFCI